MTRKQLNSILLAAAFAVLLLAPAQTWAQKRNKPGGGGGGTTANYNLVRLAYPAAKTTQAVQLNDRANVINGPNIVRGNALFL